MDELKNPRVHRNYLDRTVARSMSIGDLVLAFEKTAPDLAEALKGKPLIESRTPWGVVAFYILSVVFAHFGLGLSESSTHILAGIFVIIGSYVMRYITSGRINGIVKPADPV